MSSLGVATTIEHDNRHSGLIFRVVTSRRVAGFTLQSKSTELEANAEGLKSTGDVGGYRPGTLHLPWSRIRELHFAPPGAGEIGGLYAREGMRCSRCLVPRLTEVQAGQVIAALAYRFPATMLSVEIDLEIVTSFYSPARPFANYLPH